MTDVLLTLLSSIVKTRAALQIEIVALRHQVNVLRRSVPNRPRPRPFGPTFLDVAVARLARLALRSSPRETGNSRRLASQRFPILLDLEKPARASRETFDSQGRPRADPQHEQSPLWGAPWVHGEILKLGIELSQATVAKDMVRRPKPPSQTWCTFLENHSKELVSIDFFTVPTSRSTFSMSSWSWLTTAVE
jgi:putative transposase